MTTTLVANKVPSGLMLISDGAFSARAGSANITKNSTAHRVKAEYFIRLY